MRLIAITEEAFFVHEAEGINMLFDNGMELLHIRKPSASLRDYRCFIGQIDETYHPRLVLHEYYEEADIFNLKGVHLNSRREIYTPENARLTTSRSCHSLNEAAMCSNFDYVFLSPVYDSISKQGYRRKFTDDELTAAGRNGVINERVIALGGVTGERLPEIRQYGFGGAALIGALWEGFRDDGDCDALLTRFCNLKTISDAL